MTEPRPETTAHDPGEGRSELPAGTRWRIFAYLGFLISLMSFSDPNGALLDIPFSFLLKNALHLEAHELATFKLIAGIPLYGAFLFGLARDNWSPFGLGDRGHILVFSLTSAAIFGSFAFVPVTAGALLIAWLLLTVASLFVAGAQNGLSASIGQQNAMTGRVSTVWNVCTALPSASLYLAGGYLSQVLSGASPERATRVVFFVGAATALLLAGFALLKPASVYGHVSREHGPAPRPLDDLRRLARHRPIYPALAIWLLWNFCPGSVTSLQYHLQNVLGAADWQWGAWNAVYTASFVPTFLLFGALCRRVPLKRLLWWGAIVAVPQFLPLLFVDSVRGAIALAIPTGLMGGLATAAYLDLLIRSAPAGLQGTTLMAASSMYFVATRFGDVLGSYLLDRTGGFGACIALTTACYVMILPLLLWLPDELTAGTDGDKGARAHRP